MNFKIINKNTFYIKINKSYKNIDLDNCDEIIKKVLVSIRKKYAFNILGFFEVNIYDIKDITTIFLFKKVGDDTFYNNIDLKINNNINYINFEIDDFVLLNSYKKDKNIYKICEHYYFNEYNLQY